MARGRMINQTIDYDAEFNALSIDAQLMYLRTLAFLDRDGLIFGHPRALLAKVAPLLDFSQGQMLDIIDQWVDLGLVIRYLAKVGHVLFFKGFAKNQSGMHYDRESPSRFDPPPGWTYGPKGLVQIYAGEPPATPQDSSQSESGEPPTEPDTILRQESGEPPTEPDTILRQESGKSPARVRQESGGTPTQIEVEVKDQVQDKLKPIEDEEDTQAREPIAHAWHDYYGEEIPENLTGRLVKLESECGTDAVIHGIQVSAVAKTRNFGYLAKSARNYLPEPQEEVIHGNGYHVDFPGVHVLQPSEKTGPPSPSPLPLPPPMPHDDPWAICLAELMPSLPGVAMAYLKGSVIEAGQPSGANLAAYWAGLYSLTLLQPKRSQPNDRLVRDGAAQRPAYGRAGAQADAPRFRNLPRQNRRRACQSRANDSL